MYNECTSKAESDDVVGDGSVKNNFNPLEVMSEVFYQITNFAREVPSTSFSPRGAQYSFKRMNMPK